MKKEKMECLCCNKFFEEHELDESHDVPCYLFEGNRKGRKNQADAFGRHWLCRTCHRNYEMCLMMYLRECAKEFSSKFFKKGDDYDTD